jgi:hypothetical protein
MIVSQNVTLIFSPISKINCLATILFCKQTHFLHTISYKNKDMSIVTCAAGCVWVPNLTTWVYFQGHEDRYTIYVHASRDRPIHSSPIFAGRDIRSEKVSNYNWLKPVRSSFFLSKSVRSSLIYAEKCLLTYIIQNYRLILKKCSVFSQSAIFNDCRTSFFKRMDIFCRVWPRIY